MPFQRWVIGLPPDKIIIRVLNVPSEQTFASSFFEERLECHLETDEGNRTTNRDCAYV